MRSHFADWAAHTAAELDYLTREQVQLLFENEWTKNRKIRAFKVERAYLEIGLAGDWDLFRPSVWTAQVSLSPRWLRSS